MATWKLVVAYDGARFSGWQRQASDRSVQGTLETALTQLFGGSSITVHGAGRTDAGVHAHGQVASFRSDIPRDAESVRMGLNTILPSDVSILSACTVDGDFHARIHATNKLYRYIVLGRRDRDPFQHARAWHVRRTVDWDAVDACLGLYIGTHEFKGFRSAGCVMKRTVRSIHRAERREVAPAVHHLEYEGPGFLRYQVRILTGTAIDVGLGRRTLEDVRAALTTGDRERAGETAPPQGLYLVRVDHAQGVEGRAGGIPDEADEA